MTRQFVQGRGGFVLGCEHPGAHRSGPMLGERGGVAEELPRDHGPLAVGPGCGQDLDRRATQQAVGCRLAEIHRDRGHKSRRGWEAIHRLWKNGLPLRVTVRLIVTWNAVAVARMVLSEATSKVPSSRWST